MDGNGCMDVAAVGPSTGIPISGKCGNLGRNQAALDTAKHIVLADLDGIITYMNPASDRTLRTIEKALPVPVDQIVGGSYDVFHANPAHQRKILGDPRNLPHSLPVSEMPRNFGARTRSAGNRAVAAS